MFGRTTLNTAFAKVGQANVPLCKGGPVTRFALVLLATAVVTVFALLVAAAAGTLARFEGAAYPAVLKRAAIAFAAVLTLAAATTDALAQLLT